MSDDRDTCVYQPREFSKPTLERLTEIVRDELYSIQVLFNDACLRPILVQQLPDPLPEIVDSMASLDCCGIIVRDCTPTIPVECPELDPVDDFLIQKVCDVEDGLGVAGSWTRSAAVLSGDTVTHQQIQPRATIDGSVVHPWYRRTFNVLTGVQTSVETVLAQVPGDSTTSNVYGVIGGSTTLAYMFSQVGFGSTYRRWIVDGVTDTEQFTWPDGHVVVTGSNQAWAQRGHYIPGRGVYYITGFAVPVEEVWLTLYSRVADNGLPARTPTATFRIYEGASPYTSVDIIGPAPDGRLIVRLAGLLLLLYVDLDTGVVEQRADPAWPALVTSVSIITPFPYSIGKNSNVNSRTIYVQRTDGEPLAAANYDPGEGEGSFDAGGISLGRNLIFHPSLNKVWALSEVCLGVSEAPGPPEWLCREVIGQNGIRVTNGRGQGGDITVEMDVDCCGIIVRDCSALGEGSTDPDIVHEQIVFGNGEDVDIDTTWTVPADMTGKKVRVLVVAGGGSSNSIVASGGGGGGGVIYENDYPVTPSEVIPVYVPTSTPGAASGDNAVFGSLTAIGGGVGSQGVGGSGGGGSGQAESVEAGGVGTAGQGSNGGDGKYVSSGTRGGGGGGGAGSLGGSAEFRDDAWWTGDGGTGRYFGDIFGTDVGDGGWFASGGVGGGNSGTLSGSPSPGGGGTAEITDAVDINNNTGGGGGGPGNVPGGAGTGGGALNNQRGRSGQVIVQVYTAGAVNPPASQPAWTCTEILSGDAFLTVTNGDAQGGDPTITLNDLPISKITGLQDALDNAGGGGFLPMTTGEVPPVLVYGPDGSLIYFEVS